MLWLTVAILSYFILAVVFLIDKYLLIRAISNPKVYAFLIGSAGILLLAVIPFVDFYIPNVNQIILSLFAGASFIFALFWFFKVLQVFDVSQIVPAIGALNPLFTFALISVLSSGKEPLSPSEITAFIMLIGGGFLIAVEKEKSITLKSLKLSALAAFFFSLSFVLTKYVYLEQPFLNGLIWTRLGGVLMALIFFILWPDIKKEIFNFSENPYPLKQESFPENQDSKGVPPLVAGRGSESPAREIQFTRKSGLKKKSLGILMINQAAGALSGLLQNWAIALAPLIYVAFINALQGVQYVFLLIFSIFLSFKFPQILGEFISRKNIIQRIAAILLISGGLVLLALKQ